MICNKLRGDFIRIDKIGQYIQQQIVGNTHEQNRKIIRDQVVDLFKAEQAGTGNGENSTRVIYCVEQVDDDIVYLKRPAPLNKGFDFEIHTKNSKFNGRVHTRPRHEDIFDLLTTVKNINQTLFDRIQAIIDEIYLCNESNICSINETINVVKVETLLKLIKWLFMEQDITYWSFSGRAMLYNRLKDV